MRALYALPEIMPELPEVETIVRDMNSRAIRGCSIVAVSTGWKRTLSGMTPQSFKQRIAGAAIGGVSRRGKHIIIHLDGGSRLFIHLRMTGKLLFREAGFRPGPHDHAVFHLSDGRLLVFNDTRKFGRITLVSGDAAPTDGLGPEPLERCFTLRWFQTALATRSRRIKPLLLDQCFIAGLGNIYVDEALWEARIHPERIAASLTASEAVALRTAIRAVLRRGIRNCGTTLGSGATNFYSVAGHRGRNADQLRVFRRTGEPCPACGTAIKRLIVGQRSTHICPHCQGDE